MGLGQAKVWSARSDLQWTTSLCDGHRRKLPREARNPRNRFGQVGGAVMRWSLVVLSGLIWTMPAYAWNSFGHIEVAAVAWERMTPSTRARVDELLKLNPMYEAWTVHAAPGDK